MSRPPGYLISFARLALASLVSFLIVIPVLPLAVFFPNLAILVVKPWSKLMLTLFQIQVRIVDRNGGRYGPAGYLYVTLNQTSLVESFVGSYALPTDYRLIMGLPFALFPLLGWFTWLVGGAVLIHQIPGHAIKALNKANRRLASQCNFWVSIEGRRSPDGTVQPYKKGPAVMAIQAQATIVPVVYHGARDRLPYGEWRIRPGTVEVVLCEAIPTKGLSYEDRDLLVQKLEGIVDRELNNQ